MIPKPKRGGTWFYCPWEMEIEGGMTWCASLAEGVGLPYSRFRTAKAFRRHWRRFHGSVSGKD